MQYGALRPSSPNPRANVRQVFQHNRALRAFGRRHKLLGKHMVGMGSEPIFLTGKPLQTSAAAERAKLLKLVSQPPMPIANALNGLAAVHRAVAIGGDIRDTQVNAERAVNLDWSGGFNFAGEVEFL
jgi:hypothetical protein